MTNDAQHGVAPIASWLRQQGVWWDTNLLNIQSSPVQPSSPAGAAPSLGMFAVSDIAAGQRLCTIPKAAILSRVTTGIAAELEAGELGGSLALIVAVMYERARGKASPWCGYLDSLPQAGEYVPLLWSDAELALLRGTNLEAGVEQDRELVAEDHAEVVAQFAAERPALFPDGRGCSLDDFKAAASWVASRAFFVDALHGEAMVPLADIFNHKASVVELSAEYEVAEGADPSNGGGQHEDDGSEDGSDDGGGDDGSDGGGDAGSGGASGGASGKREAAEQQQQQQQQPAHKEGSAPVPALDADAMGAPEADGADGNGDADALPAIHPAGGGEEVAAGDPRATLRLEIGICDVERDGVDMLEIVAASGVAAGAEVRNTYGEHGNDELVKKYGFALSPALPAAGGGQPAEGGNPFDVVLLRKDAFGRCLAARLGAAE